MTVWKESDRRAWRYDFWYHGERYRGSTGQLTREDAEDYEEQEKRRVRRAAHGLEVRPEHTPAITDWAAEYYDYVTARGKVRRLDHIDNSLRVVLRFWGAKPAGGNPKNPPFEGEPYHDLRLAHPIRDPDWIEKFEEWIRARGSSKQTRLHYMSIMSRMYRVAMLPKFVKRTGVTSNPFLTVERDKPVGRKVTVTPAELRTWLQRAARHVQLAIAIGALAPKLRLANVLQLRWDRSIDPAFTYITVGEHKTMDQTQAPMVIPITKQLRTLLKAAKAESRTPFVVTYRGKPVKSIRAGVRSAATRAGLTYGRDVGGVTFHTIRHTAATLLAEIPSLTEAQRAATMGQDIATTQEYTHLRPASQRPVLTRLGQRLKLDAILAEAFGTPGGQAGGPPSGEARKRAEKRRMRMAHAKGRHGQIRRKKSA